MFESDGSESNSHIQARYHRYCKGRNLLQAMETNYDLTNKAELHK